MSDRRLRDEEVDRLLREALPDDLPAALEAELRRDVRRAWQRAASAGAPWRWRERVASAWRSVLPQPALAAAALVMLAAGAVMQAAPAPGPVVAALEARQAAARTAAALARARALQCTVEIEARPGRVRRYRVEWRTPGPTHLSFDGKVASVARAPGVAVSAPSLVAPATTAGRLDADVEPVRGYLTPPALASALAAPRMTISFDPATHLPVRLEGTDREGRRQAAVCLWP